MRQKQQLCAAVFTTKAGAFACEIFKSVKNGVAVPLSLCTIRFYRRIFIPIQPVFSSTKSRALKWHS